MGIFFIYWLALRTKETHTHTHKSFLTKFYLFNISSFQYSTHQSLYISYTHTPTHTLVTVEHKQAHYLNHLFTAHNRIFFIFYFLTLSLPKLWTVSFTFKHSIKKITKHPKLLCHCWCSWLSICKVASKKRERKRGEKLWVPIECFECLSQCHQTAWCAHSANSVPLQPLKAKIARQEWKPTEHALTLKVGQRQEFGPVGWRLAAQHLAQLLEHWASHKETHKRKILHSSNSHTWAGCGSCTSTLAAAASASTSAVQPSPPVSYLSKSWSSQVFIFLQHS